jgi:heat shock protein HtpX
MCACVTSGLLKTMNRGELEGVVAHEMSHIENYDIRFASMVAVLVGLIFIGSQIFLRSM